jgi:membrane fusion protein (multidrug efflux system)
MGAAGRELARAQGAAAFTPARLRWALFLLLPLVLIVGAYLYFEGGAYMSTDDAYIETDKAGLSTDVSGMVEAIEVRDNQHVAAGQVLFRLDPLPFQLKLDQAQAWLGVIRDNLNALKANYQNEQAQIKQAEDQIAFNQLQEQRQEILARQQFIRKRHWTRRGSTCRLRSKR